MAENSDLGKIAKEYRNNNIFSKNLYHKDNMYGATHPNATQQTSQDDPLNKKGKGTGVVFDTANGGSSVDINGDPNVIAKTGRAATVINKYNKDNQYECFVSDEF